MPAPARSPVPHALLLALAAAAGLGIGRFAYALILPDMRAELGWSYTQAGWMNASNAIGYLAGALVCARVISRSGAAATMLAGVVLCLAATLANGLLSGDIALNLMRLMAGAGGAFAFIAGGLMATRHAQANPAQAGLLIGIFYAGIGFGILTSGLVTPLAALAAPATGLAGWRVAWLVLAALCLPMLLLLARTAGAGQRGGSHAAAPAPLRPMLPILVAYLVFGAGYIAYMTFMFALVRQTGAGTGFLTLFWSAIGLSAMASAWVWAGLYTRLRHGGPFAVLCCVTALGGLVPVLSTSVPALLVSAALFGGSMFAVVASTTAFVRRNLPESQWASGIGIFAIAFAVGQSLGPVATGWISDRFGGLEAGLAVSVILLAAAAAGGALQRDLAKQT